MEARIAELEIRFTHQQDLLQQLNDVLILQQKRIDRLEAEVDGLRKRLGAEASALDPDERPPHY